MSARRSGDVSRPFGDHRVRHMDLRAIGVGRVWVSGECGSEIAALAPRGWRFGAHAECCARGEWVTVFAGRCSKVGVAGVVG